MACHCIQILDINIFQVNLKAVITKFTKSLECITTYSIQCDTQVTNFVIKMFR